MYVGTTAVYTLPHDYRVGPKTHVTCIPTRDILYRRVRLTNRVRSVYRVIFNGFRFKKPAPGSTLVKYLLSTKQDSMSSGVIYMCIGNPRNDDDSHRRKESLCIYIYMYRTYTPHHGS